MAARYDRVKLLLWFPRKDHAVRSSYRDPWGNFSGLRTLGGRRKRAYYAFAGGNTLTMRPVRCVRLGSPLTLRGRLTNERLGPLAGKVLSVRSRRPGRPWTTVARIRTRADGRYLIRVRPRRGATWQVRWTGVVASPVDWVPVTGR